MMASERKLTKVDLAEVRAVQSLLRELGIEPRGYTLVSPWARQQIAIRAFVRRRALAQQGETR